MITGPQLAPTIILPTTPVISAGDLCRVFSVTRQSISNWRALYNFPAADHCGPRSFTRTADVAAFVTAHGATVQWC